MISAAARTSAFTAPLNPPGDVGSDRPVSSPSQATADQYNAWAQRLRQKRVNAQRAIADDESTADPLAANWSSTNVFTESQRVADNDLRAHHDPVGVSAAYAVLGLDMGTPLDEVDARYRILAKRHHPDRFIGADEAVQREHAEMFRAISTARDVVRMSFGGL